MSTDLRTYKARVLEAMRRANSTHQPEVFENSGPDHARIVLDVMLENASQSVDVITSRMHESVWSEQSVKGFLSRNPEGRIRVLLDDAPLGQIPKGSLLHGILHERQVDARWLSIPLSNHACVTDGSHVRLEYDKQTREASITFGDPNGVGGRVVEIFETLWSCASPAPVETHAL